MSAFDTNAGQFDRHRALPDGVPEAIRRAILGEFAAPRPRLLDLGAGSGRVGWTFIAAGDDYVAVDLSFGMLTAFAARGATMLAQADGGLLPFADDSFDAVLMVQVFGGLDRWRDVIDDARRVLRPGGALIFGRTIRPDDGIDARMKHRLKSILGNRGVERRAQNTRRQAEEHLDTVAGSVTTRVAAQWSAETSPRDFLERHSGGARFAQLPAAEREDALRALANWARTEFGALDAMQRERQQFELRLYRF